MSRRPLKVREKNYLHGRIGYPDSDQRSEWGNPDAELAALVAMWPTLPDHILAAIRALVGTVAGPS